MVWLGTVLKLLHLRSQGRDSGCFQAEELALVVLAENENKYSIFHPTPHSPLDALACSQRFRVVKSSSVKLVCTTKPIWKFDMLHCNRLIITCTRL